MQSGRTTWVISPITGWNKYVYRDILTGYNQWHAAYTEHNRSISAIWEISWISGGILSQNMCSLLWKAFSYFQVLEKISVLVKAYVVDIQLCFNTCNYTTSWQHLEIGIMVRCTISLLAFTMEIEVIIIASKWVIVGGAGRHPVSSYPSLQGRHDNTYNCSMYLLAVSQVEWQSDMGKDESET